MDKLKRDPSYSLDTKRPVTQVSKVRARARGARLTDMCNGPFSIYTIARITFQLIHLKSPDNQLSLKKKVAQISSLVIPVGLCACSDFFSVTFSKIQMVFVFHFQHLHFYIYVIYDSIFKKQRLLRNFWCIICHDKY